MLSECSPVASLGCLPNPLFPNGAVPDDKVSVYDKPGDMKWISGNIMDDQNLRVQGSGAWRNYSAGRTFECDTSPAGSRSRACLQSSESDPHSEAAYRESDRSIGRLIQRLRVESNSESENSTPCFTHLIFAAQFSPWDSYAPTSQGPLGPSLGSGRGRPR